MEDKLDSSIPANNEKIIELYNKIKSGTLNPSPDYQRKLVWKKQHKINFINTILNNYPFPEVYIAPGEVDPDKMTLKDEIVDGQQRLTTIVSYIDGTDIFSQKTSIPNYKSLEKDEKTDFVNYEVSVRYLKKATKEQTKEIFKRINSTEYSLNSVEKMNAQWGDSEFVCFAKQIIEEDPNINPDTIGYIIHENERKEFVDFFHTKYDVFSENDNNRMLSLQIILTLLTTIHEGRYFRRNDRTQKTIEEFNDEFTGAEEVKDNLLETIRFLSSFDFPKSSYFCNKTNIFTLLVELYHIDLATIDAQKTKENFENLFDTEYKKFLIEQEDYANVEYKKYFEHTRDGVNEKGAREYRGEIIRSLLVSKES